MSEQRVQQLFRLIEETYGLLGELDNALLLTPYDNPIQIRRVKQDIETIKAQIERFEVELEGINEPYPNKALVSIQGLYLDKLGTSLGVLSELTSSDTEPIHFVRANNETTIGYCRPCSNGSIYWCERASAQPVYGPIRKIYEKINGINLIGFPLTAPLEAKTSAQGTEGLYQCFEGAFDYPGFLTEPYKKTPFGATIYWNEKYGGYLTTGKIGLYYEQLDSTAGLLGFPISEEIATETSAMGTTGKYQRFESGEVFSSEKYGTIAITGVTLKLFEELGGVAGELGFPTLYSLNSATYNSIQCFENGVILADSEKAVAYKGQLLGYTG